MVASAAVRSSALSETSALTPSTSALVRLRSAPALASASSSMSHSMTFTPACDSAVAIPNPIPDAAPVTNAVCPDRSFMCVISSVNSRFARNVRCDGLLPPPLHDNYRRKRVERNDKAKRKTIVPAPAPRETEQSGAECAHRAADRGEQPHHDRKACGLEFPMNDERRQRDEITDREAEQR